MDLRQVVAVTRPGPTNGLTPARRAYFSGREIERWAEFGAAPIMQGFPTDHDKEMILPNGMLIAGLLQAVNVDRLAHCMLEAHWRDDADRADIGTLTRLGKTAGIDPDVRSSGRLPAHGRDPRQKETWLGKLGCPEGRGLMGRRSDPGTLREISWVGVTHWRSRAYTR